MSNIKLLLAAKTFITMDFFHGKITVLTGLGCRSREPQHLNRQKVHPTKTITPAEIGLCPAGVGSQETKTTRRPLNPKNKPPLRALYSSRLL